MLLTKEKIERVIKEAHKKNPGKILAAIEIYEAIAQAQHKEDTEMEIAEKVKLLKGLDTKELIQKLHQYEDELEKAMTAEADFKSQNHLFLASRGSDCQEVKRILAELSVLIPEANDAGKKMTVADREIWLIKQRKENKELDKVIVKQKEVTFLLDDHQIKVEIVKKRLEGIKAILSLKTAQINFLAAS